ncbi:MAG: FKBP-type peptidyl-prolyl cis-trans isomerase [Alphaproteobacteria bacterium]|nr:FKBP-type peptidyl-prolyl cis-trans isomerase [Alphaproteobacteria bacterium]
MRDSGLGVADLVVGTGDEATRGATVLVEYTGWLEDGRRFDSSLARAAPFGFTIGAHEVIPGWEEGVQGMRIGGTRLLRVPYKLGYGSAGNPPTIPRKATLLFEVRLLEVRAR